MSKCKCGVYKITCTTNDKIYIGSSKNIDKRWKEHRWDLDHNKHCNKFLQEDWNKHGESCFTFEIVEETEMSETFEVEQKYLDKLKPYYRNGNGYNINENALMKNSNRIRIFKNRYRILNPFYGASKEQVKNMLKLKDDFGDLLYDTHSEDGINTKNMHMWVDDPNNTYIISYRGMFGKHHQREIDADFIDDNSREDIFWHMLGLDAYEELKSYKYESDNYDDWE